MPTLVTISNPRSPVSEAYRTLRTNIQFYSHDRALRTILVTSPGPEEGKTTTVGNLAVTFAEAGKNVVVVDCDLRRPSLHKLFDVPNERGLSTLFQSEADPQSLLVSSTVAHLRILPSGPIPPNPSELLGSQRMERIIQGLCECADVVLFDCAPTIAVSDSAVLGSKVDGVLLVVSVGKTKRDHATRARKNLEKVNANLLGVVLNNVKVDASLYRYYG